MSTFLAPGWRSLGRLGERSGARAAGAENGDSFGVGGAVHVGREEQRVGRERCGPMRNRYQKETDGLGVALAIHLSLYSFVFAIFALWLYSLLQPKLVPNPGVAAYKPPPGTVISYHVPGRLLAQHGQPPELADLPPTPEADQTTGRSVQAVEQVPESQRMSKQRSPSDRRLLLRRASAAIPGALMQHRTRRTRLIVRSSAWIADIERHLPYDAHQGGPRRLTASHAARGGVRRAGSPL